MMTHKRSNWKHFVLIALVVVAAAGVWATPAWITQAQSGGTLGYGTKVFGTIASAGAYVRYSFTGTEGDLVSINVSNWTNTLDPKIDLAGPDQQLLASNTTNQFAIDRRNAYVSAFLPQDGVYSVVVSGMNGTTGDYLLKFGGRSPVEATPLTYGVPVEVEVPLNAEPQYFAYDAEDCPTTLIVTDRAAGEPYTFPYVVKERNEQGRLIANLRGGSTIEERVTVEALSGHYEVEVHSNDPALMEGAIQLLVTCTGNAPACPGGAANLPGSALPPAECPACPPCGEEPPGGGETQPPGEVQPPGVVIPPQGVPLCENLALNVQYSSTNANTATFSWNAVPEIGTGGYYQLTVYDNATNYTWLSGSVYSTTSATIDFTAPAYSGHTSFLVQVAAVDGTNAVICANVVTVEFPDLTFVPSCGRFRLSAPREGLPNGPGMVYWDPAPDATSYRVNVYNENGVLVSSTDVAAPTTNTSIDFSEGAIGPGFTFTLEVLALYNGSVFCSDRVTQFREAATPPPGEIITPNPPPLPVCGNGICEEGEDINSCDSDCTCGNGVCEPERGEDIDSCPFDC